MTFALPLLLLAWPALAAEPTLSLSTTTVELGKPVAAVAVAPAALEPDLEAATTDTYSISLAGEPKPAADGVQWPLQIVPLAVGTFPVQLRWKGADAVSGAALTVAEPAGLGKDAEVADIKAPARARPRIWPWLALLATLGGAYYAWRRWKRKTGVEISAAEAADARSPAERALDELAALERKPLWEERRYKEFYFELTEIVRAYLERRYGMPALKLTTYELGRQLRQAELDRQTVALFKDLFDRADLVKFAKTTPEAGQGALDVASARRLVELTKPRDLAPAAEAGS